MKTADKYNELLKQGQYDTAEVLLAEAWTEVDKYLKDGLNIIEAMDKAGFVKDNKLQDALNSIIEQEKDKNPYFPNVAPFAYLGRRDEYLDELLELAKFDISGSLVEYVKELRSFKIDIFLNSVGIETKQIIDLIEKHISIIKENTDKPLFAQNKITETLKICDQSPYVGQITQILFLQGLVKWFEYCEFDDNAQDEIQSIFDEICERLMEVVGFYFYCYYNKVALFTPLDEYLASTELGKLCIECQNEKELSNTESIQISGDKKISIELITQIQELCIDRTEVKHIESLVRTGVNKDNKVVLKADTTIEAMLNILMPAIDANIFDIHIKESDSQKEKARYLHTLFNVFTEGSIKKDISKYHGKAKK